MISILRKCSIREEGGGERREMRDEKLTYVWPVLCIEIQ